MRRNSLNFDREDRKSIFHVGDICERYEILISKVWTVISIGNGELIIFSCIEKFCLYYLNRYFTTSFVHFFPLFHQILAFSFSMYIEMWSIEFDENVPLSIQTWKIFLFVRLSSICTEGYWFHCNEFEKVKLSIQFARFWCAFINWVQEKLEFSLYLSL